MAGSTGAVAAPILSRLYQYVSDGLAGYNQARKVAYNPFPFPHGQTTALFSLAIIFIFPILYLSFVNIVWFAAVMNFSTVLCFLGTHEVARELETPFQNVPNDLPLITFQAQFNEALVTMYAGFHPDAWWHVAPETSAVPQNGEQMANTEIFNLTSVGCEGWSIEEEEASGESSIVGP
jgi:predicted membrane chloride channel (bestrophin family)